MLTARLLGPNNSLTAEIEESVNYNFALIGVPDLHSLLINDGSLSLCLPIERLSNGLVYLQMLLYFDPKR